MNKLLRNVQDYNVLDHYLYRDTFKWGTYGKKLDQPLRYVYLKDMSNSHIINVLTNCNLTEEIKEVFSREIYFRMENPEFSIKGDTINFIEEYNIRDSLNDKLVSLLNIW